jgi:quinol---cytochrome-c reductase cytochrome b subunit
VIRGIVHFVDSRSGGAPFVKKALRYVFPDHWSFLLGEVALYVFMLLVATGIYLTLFFDDSHSLTVYHGSYTPLAGASMSHAYESVVHLSTSAPACSSARRTTGRPTSSLRRSCCTSCASCSRVRTGSRVTSRTSSA